MYGMRRDATTQEWRFAYDDIEWERLLEPFNEPRSMPEAHARLAEKPCRLWWEQFVSFALLEGMLRFDGFNVVRSFVGTSHVAKEHQRGVT